MGSPIENLWRVAKLLLIFKGRLNDLIRICNIGTKLLRFFQSFNLIKNTTSSMFCITAKMTAECSLLAKIGFPPHDLHNSRHFLRLTNRSKTTYLKNRSEMFLFFLFWLILPLCGMLSQVKGYEAARDVVAWYIHWKSLKLLPFSSWSCLSIQWE